MHGTILHARPVPPTTSPRHRKRSTIRWVSTRGLTAYRIASVRHNTRGLCRASNTTSDPEITQHHSRHSTLGQ
eukprot:3215602-Rhodomonas_salina.1